MSAAADAESVTLRSRRPLAPAFHQHIAKGKLIDHTCRIGDRIVIYDVVGTKPAGVVRVTRETRFQFE